MARRKPVAVVCADTHLQKRTWKHRPIMGDAYHAFQQITDYAVQHELPIIGAGDLIDKRINESDPIVFLQRELTRLNNHGLDFYFIQGQHEMSDVPWFKLSPSSVGINGVCLELGGFNMYGMDYTPKDLFEQRLAEIPEEANLLVCHQVWGDFMGDIALPQGDFADLPEQIEYVITGDYHGKTVLEKYRGKAGQEMQVFNPGSTCMQSVDEPTQKHFGVLCTDGTIKKIKIKSRVFEEFLLSSQDEIEDFITNIHFRIEAVHRHNEQNGLPEELHTPLWRIVYPHRLSEDMRRVANMVGDRAHLFWKEIAPTREEAIAERNIVNVPAEGEALTLEGCLTEAVDPINEPMTFRLSQRLLQAGSTAEDKELEVQRWLKEQLDDDGEGVEGS